MGARTGIEISSDKLREELRRRGLNGTAVSKEIGFSDAYMSYVLKNGVIGKPAANLLKMRYNIDVETLKPNVPVAEKPATPEPTTDELKSEIAVLTKAVNELAEEFRNYRVAMLGYAKKWENHKKYGHF